MRSPVFTYFSYTDSKFRTFLFPSTIFLMLPLPIQSHWAITKTKTINKIREKKPDNVKMFSYCFSMN